MTDFKFTFTNPWLLLLIIPALFITLFPYFRIAKKYRRNRNRVTSVVLHSIICVLAVSVLAGLAFEYDVPNNQNEVLLVVDASHSGADSEDRKDDFIRSVLEESGSDFKMGVVAFGYNQIYAAPLTNDTDKVYDTYVSAMNAARANKTFDESATDIAGALNYARTLFETPATAKIVLVSDGIETDGSAENVIRSIAAEGIKVDTVCFPPSVHENEVQLVGVETPDYNVTEGSEVTITANLQSSFEGSVIVTLYDNDIVGESVEVDMKIGVQPVAFAHTFTGAGLHKLRIKVLSAADDLTENNEYCSYFFLNVFDKVLIIENRERESDMLKDILAKKDGEQGGFEIETVCIRDSAAVPSTVDELRNYDQVILLNISNADMQTVSGLDAALNTYVNEIGGGLLTVGGNDDFGNANVYDRKDMLGTLYQDMLPVQAIDYTPPLGVVIVIDHSGSMDSNGTGSDKTRLQLAKEGAMSCLGVLTERDYCGVMAFAQEADTVIEPTPAPQSRRIRAAIDRIGSEDENLNLGSDGTVFSGALRLAGTQLRALTNVQKRHIILVTDGDPGDSLLEYGAVIENNFRSGITLSIVSVDNGSSKVEDMQAAVDMAGGSAAGSNYYQSTASGLAATMRNDLNIPEIKDYNPEPFRPLVENSTPGIITGDLIGAVIPELGGFYGTKAKDGATVTLRSEYTPVYAHWKYGKGMVGSFMCDLEGEWSRDFIGDDVGIKLINNIVTTLMPTQDIRYRDIDAKVTEDNYKTQLSIYTSLKESETVSVKITAPNGSELQSATFAATDNYSRYTFDNLTPGIYEITLTKTHADGSITSFVTYKSFSYSKEYNAFVDERGGIEFMKTLAVNGKGEFVSPDEPWEVFETVVKTLHRRADPRLVFLIMIIVLFLLDIAARKFKFKWPHEIIRDIKAKKELGKTK
ncbi:MAG: VWA domain-containing protein [Clostridia bacterium]|nr:VWA domain-containing protein [Clostridia bacterium]